MSGHILLGLVPGFLRSLHLLLVGFQDPSLDHLPGFGVDRVGDIHVAARSVGGACGRGREPATALTAIFRPKKIFVVAVRAVNRHSTTGHGDKWAVRTVDHSDVSNHKRFVEGNGTKRHQLIIRMRKQTDPNLGDIHDDPF
jgi:hypothetical protein